MSQNSTVLAAAEHTLPNANHMLGDTANTGKEIEQSQGEMKSKYVPEGRFISPYVGRDSFSWEEEEQRPTYV